MPTNHKSVARVGHHSGAVPGQAVTVSAGARIQEILHNKANVVESLDRRSGPSSCAPDREHHYVSLDETECPFCHARLLPVENVVDEIVEIARLHGVNVTIVEYRQELMAKYDGIAAVTHVQAN